MVSSENIVILSIVTIYMLLVIGIGFLAARSTSSSREDFLLADRSFNTVILFFALAATNMTAVVMIGAPGLAYRTGAGALGFFISLFAFLFPVFMMTFGHRIWLVGKRFGHITPGQIVNHRWEADYLGAMFMIMFTIWTIPYILVGVQGGGIVFEVLTDGLIPYWLGTLIVITIVGLYVYPGGMRGTGWTNTFQGAVFSIVLIGILVALGFRIGGFSTATQSVAEISGGVFLDRSGIPPFGPRMWFSQGIIIALGAFMFPHLIIRYMTARSPKALRQTSVLYPIGMVIVWIPTVMIGFWGIAQVPDITNSDFILPTLVNEFLPWWVVGVALAGILAALMSSIDGQVLTLGTFFSEDIVSEFFEDVTDQRAVWYTRLFLIVIFGLAYIGALITSDTILDTATFAFAGNGLMFIPMAAAFYWRWSTKEAIYVGLLYGFGSLWLFEYGPLPETILGFHPFVPLLITQFILMALISAITENPAEERVRKYESIFENIW